jgi:hypothetical protein
MIRAGEFFVYWRGLVLVRHRRSFEVVERGNYETIYCNMPVFGLAKATEHVRAVGGRDGAQAPHAWGERTSRPFSRVTTLKPETATSLDASLRLG